MVARCSVCFEAAPRAATNADYISYVVKRQRLLSLEVSLSAVITAWSGHHRYRISLCNNALLGSHCFCCHFGRSLYRFVRRSLPLGGHYLITARCIYVAVTYTAIASQVASFGGHYRFIIWRSLPLITSQLALSAVITALWRSLPLIAPQVASFGGHYRSILLQKSRLRFQLSSSGG